MQITAVGETGDSGMSWKSWQILVFALVLVQIDNRHPDTISHQEDHSGLPSGAYLVVIILALPLLEIGIPAT